jgi:hypothetical protein
MRNISIALSLSAIAFFLGSLGYVVISSLLGAAMQQKLQLDTSLTGVPRHPSKLPWVK